LFFKVAWRPGGWTRWLLFPPVLLILAIIANFDIAKRFNKPGLFGLWLWILPIVFYPILAFDKKAKWTPKKK
jgi:O-antigen ligase